MNDQEHTKMAARLSKISGASAGILLTLVGVALSDQIRAVPLWAFITAATILITVWIRPTIIQESVKATKTAAVVLAGIVVQTLQNATFWLLVATGCAVTFIALITISDIRRIEALGNSRYTRAICSGTGCINIEYKVRQCVSEAIQVGGLEIRGRWDRGDTEAARNHYRDCLIANAAGWETCTWGGKGCKYLRGYDPSETTGQPLFEHPNAR